MKRAIIFSIIFSICTTLSAQIQEETFNAASIPAGWTATSTPGSGCSWQFGYTGKMPGTNNGNPTSDFPTGAAFFEDNYYIENPDGCPDDGYTVELTGPAVDLVAAGVISADVEIVYNHQAFGISGNFMVDVWNGISWQNILFVDADSPSSTSSTNQTATIDVTPYINSAFRIKFIYQDENSVTWGVGIDNYMLLDTATAGIEDLAELGFSYYPNPTVNNELQLRADQEIDIVNVYNTIGQKIITRKPTLNKDTIKMDHLPSGVYIVHVVIAEKEGSFKIIKQ